MGERGAPRRAEWDIPAADVSAGAAEVVRLVHAALPVLAWGRRAGGAYAAGPVPHPRPLPGELTDAEHSGFLVRLAGLLSFLGAHGLGVSSAGLNGLGCRPGTRDVPWLSGPPVPAWRAVPAAHAIGIAALRLAGRDLPCEGDAEVRRALEEALGDGLPPRTAQAVTVVLCAADGGRRSDALLLDLARAGGAGERVATDLLGLVLPRELQPMEGDRLVSAGAAAGWLGRGAARRAPGEVAFAEAGPPDSVVEGAALAMLAEGLGPDPRAKALRALSRGEAAPAEAGPPLVLLALEPDRWDGRSLRAWETLPDALGPVVRIEARAEAPAPWHTAALLVPRLGREEVAGLVHLPLSSPSALARLWEGLAAEAAGDPARLLRAARQRARSLLSATPDGPSRRRTGGPVDIVVRASALLGDGFSASEAAAVSGAPLARAAEAVETACDEGTLSRASASTFRFADDTRRRRLATGLTSAERASCLARLKEASAGGVRLLLARLASGPGPGDVDEARQALVEALRTGRAADAVALLQRAPQAAPDLGEPLLASEAYASAGRMEEARAAAGRVDPRKALTQTLARRERSAVLLARLGEPDNALALLPPTEEADGRLARAGLLLRLRREEEAAVLLDGLEPPDGPARARAHLLRAELHERRQELAAAEAELGEVAAALEGRADDPWLVDAAFTAGYLALDLGRPREARAFFRTARDEARDPSRRADALFDLSVAAAEDGQLADAEASLAEALALFSSLGERDRYLSALGQRAALSLRRSDARGALRDVKVVLAHDRAPGRGFQLLFSIPLRQRLALAEGDEEEGAEAFAEALARFAECPEHPARREVLVLEGARLLACGRPAEALARVEEAEPHPDARSGVEPYRARLAASARRDLGRMAPAPPKLDAAERALLDAEERLARGLAPSTGARELLAGRLARPEGPFEVASRLVEWRGRFPGFFASEDASAWRELGLRAARRAGLDGAAARFASRPAGAARAGGGPAVPPDLSCVAEDAATREVFDTARRVAPHRISVLVLGESGTGKELVAREIHRASGRGGPFVAMNVAALPEPLAEAELFGAARGAFTGADRDRAGVIEASSGGTLFLDEIGDLSPQVQAKLLRVLQEHEVRRLGETRHRAVDLRIVAATHRDLSRLAGEGLFRPDLLYRIAGITVTLPPLRERPRDLRALLERALGGTPVAPGARTALLSWSWPGNVRELFSAVEAARALAGPGGRVETGHLPVRLRGGPEAPAAGTGRYRHAVDEAKRRVIVETLSETGGNRTRAAALLGLSRQSLLYELKRLGVDARRS